MAGTIHCTIVTPSESVFDGEVSYASVPCWDGQRGVMENASPVLSRLGAGALRLDTPGGDKHWYMLDGGFAQVQDNGLTLLTEYAVPASSLSREAATAELEEANAALHGAGEQLSSVVAAQQRALAKIAVLNATA